MLHSDYAIVVSIVDSADIAVVVMAAVVACVLVRYRRNSFLDRAIVVPDVMVFARGGPLFLLTPSIDVVVVATYSKRVS